jgi:TM2 domain-containing membrane protein YozV
MTAAAPKNATTDRAVFAPTAQAFPPITPTGYKDAGVAYVLLTLLGVFGAHRFYLGKPGSGILYLLTGGLLGVGLLVDIFRLTALTREANRRISGRAF